MADAGRGLYGALNTGLSAAGPEWTACTWINDDDLLLTPGFNVGVAELARRPEADLVYGRVGLIDGTGERIGTLPVARHGGDLGALLARGIMPLAQPGTVIRRKVFDRLGGFDESYRIAGDLEFFVRALLAGGRFAFANARVASFRLHGGQLSKQRVEAEAETRRALLPLARHSRPLGALLRFRLGNVGAYLDRFRRHGWKSMREIYDGPSGNP